jgi:hypothetical protein
MSLNDYELVFTSGTEARLFIDPIEVIDLFPEAPAVDVFELVRFYSVEMEDIFHFAPEDPIPPDIQEYVKAATACALMRVYNFGGGGGAGDVSFRLGDLQVDNNRSNTAPVNRLNAGNWCELAAALREEILRTGPGAGLRAVVKGSNFPNPMPCRIIRPKEHMPTTIW